MAMRRGLESWAGGGFAKRKRRATKEDMKMSTVAKRKKVGGESM